VKMPIADWLPHPPPLYIIIGFGLIETVSKFKAKHDELFCCQPFSNPIVMITIIFPKKPNRKKNDCRDTVNAS